MSLVKKSDVKNHLSPSFRSKSYLKAPVSHVDASGYSLTGPTATETDQSSFDMDYSGEHAIAAAQLTLAVKPTGSIDSLATKTSKSAQA